MRLKRFNEFKCYGCNLARIRKLKKKVQNYSNCKVLLLFGNIIYLQKPRTFRVHQVPALISHPRLRRLLHHLTQLTTMRTITATSSKKPITDSTTMPVVVWCHGNSSADGTYSATLVIRQPSKSVTGMWTVTGQLGQGTQRDILSMWGDFFSFFNVYMISREQGHMRIIKQIYTCCTDQQSFMDGVSVLLVKLEN